jgi:hypothetical protein
VRRKTRALGRRGEARRDEQARILVGVENGEHGYLLGFLYIAIHTL